MKGMKMKTKAVLKNALSKLQNNFFLKRLFVDKIDIEKMKELREKQTIQHVNKWII